jgi:protoporphyrinogen IX oxidase
MYFAGAYLWLKAFHIMAVIAWFAGLFYIFRLFVYHIESDSADVHRLMESAEAKLLRIIMNPAMIVAWTLGILLIAMQSPYIFSQGWLHIKLLFVVLLTGYHMYAARVRKQLLAGTCKLTGKQARLINEVPAVIMLVVVLMVELQPFK